MANLEALFAATADGKPAARQQLFAALYAELRRIAQRELRRNGALTLSPTTVLHEAYLQIAGRDGAQFPDKDRFMAYAARAMRGLIIDHLRERHAQKRGSAFEFTALTQGMNVAAGAGEDLSAMGAAIDELSSADPALAELVDLKYFCGFTVAEIATLRGMSERTVKRDWEKARLFLFARLNEDLST